MTLQNGQKKRPNCKQQVVSGESTRCRPMTRMVSRWLPMLFWCWNRGIDPAMPCKEKDNSRGNFRQVQQWGTVKFRKEWSMREGEATTYWTHSLQGFVGSFHCGLVHKPVRYKKLWTYQKPTPQWINSGRNCRQPQREMWRKLWSKSEGHPLSEVRQLESAGGRELRGRRFVWTWRIWEYCIELGISGVEHRKQNFCRWGTQWIWSRWNRRSLCVALCGSSIQNRSQREIIKDRQEMPSIRLWGGLQEIFEALKMQEFQGFSESIWRSNELEWKKSGTIDWIRSTGSSTWSKKPY